MAEGQSCMPPSEDDLRAALREMRTYVDITEEDLMKIYEIALRHAQERLSKQSPVRDLMSTNVVTVLPEADIHEAARLLSENRISGMPVVQEDGRVIGVLSEADLLVMTGMERGHGFRDIIRMVLGEKRPVRSKGNSVSDVMSTPPITCRTDDDAAAVAKVLDTKRIKRLPVVDDAGKLVGIISRADIVRSLGRK